MSEKTYWDDYDAGRVATECDVSYKPTHSQLLDANGNRMKYEDRRVGFALTPKRYNKGDTK